MAVKAVIFDCFGVLVMSGRPRLLRDFPDKTDEICDLQIRSDYGMISRREYDNGIAELTGLSPDEVELKYWNACQRCEDVISYVKQLKCDGKYKLALLSNIGTDWLDDFIPKSELAEMFDVTVLSGEVMMAKPDAQIFEYTAKKLLVNPSDCIFIDDTMVNVEAAEYVGMTGIVFGTFDQAKTDLELILGD